MNFFRLFIQKNFYLALFFLTSIFFLYSLYVLQFHYDGHHIGLMYSNALDFNKGKLPYKEIFIQYGLLTTIIHSVTLYLFDNNIFSLSIITLTFYQLSILLISLTINNLINKEYAIISYLILLMNHPIPWLPWSNYIAFFFITLGIFLLTKRNKNFFIIGVVFSLIFLSRQDYLIAITTSIICIVLFLFIKKKETHFKNTIAIISGFSFPIFIFLIYLSINSIFFEWSALLQLPNFYLEIYQTNIHQLIKDFIIFFISESFFKFIVTPQYFLISIILISNTVFIIMKIFKKIEMDNTIFFISIFCLFLSSMSLKIELFRLYTSVSIGVIPLFYFINRIHLTDLRKKIIMVLFLPSLFAFIFYPLGNNPIFSKINFQLINIDHNLNQFKHHKWSLKKTSTLNKINELTMHCKVSYLENLTFDALYSTIGNFNRIRLLPYVKSSMKDSKLTFFLDNIKNSNENFVSLINSEITKKNIIVLINEGNNSFANQRIIFNTDYSVFELNLNSDLQKPNILRIYMPKNCINKI